MNSSIETLHTNERGRGSGFSDWQRVAKETGNLALSAFLNPYDTGTATDHKNPHVENSRAIEQLGLPIQTFVSPSVSDFLQTPEEYFARLDEGDYFFASVEPGVHIAHATNSNDVVEFIKDYLHTKPSEADRELYLSCNGEPVMSGHVFVDREESPNPVMAEFTIDNFNAFHRGLHAPEISITRRASRRFEWIFNGDLSPRGGDWRTEEQFQCNGNVMMTRVEMARRAYHALSLIPHDDEYLLPGYYEVLLEKSGESSTKPKFIEYVRR